MNIQILFNGNLEMTATKKEQRELKRIKDKQTYTAESDFIKKYLFPFVQVKPEECGALTSATLITDGTNVFGDMSYQVQSFIETLAEGKSVIWTKG